MEVEDNEDKELQEAIARSVEDQANLVRDSWEVIYEFGVDSIGVAVIQEWLGIL
jgi:hypothetical protein